MCMCDFLFLLDSTLLRLLRVLLYPQCSCCKYIPACYAFSHFILIPRQIP